MFKIKCTNIKFENNRHKSKEMLEIIHTNINGPHPNGCNDEKYFVSFIDDHSNIAKVYIMKAVTMCVFFSRTQLSYSP